MAASHYSLTESEKRQISRRSHYSLTASEKGQIEHALQNSHMHQADGVVADSGASVIARRGSDRDAAAQMERLQIRNETLSDGDMESVDALSAESSQPGPHPTIRHPGIHNMPPFLSKLYDILENKSMVQYISWSADGKSVAVKKLKEFSAVVLPQYFKHSKFSSFLRQLNMYNFRTTKQEVNYREFQNSLFERGKPHLIGQIKRKIAAGTKAKRAEAAKAAKAERERQAAMLQTANDAGSGPRSKKMKQTKPRSAAAAAQQAAFAAQQEVVNLRARVGALERKNAAMEQNMKNM